jgi:alanine racemase
VPPATAIPPIQAIVDLTALGHNLSEVRRRLPDGCEVLAVVKADAYGHGAVPIAQALESLGVTRFGVATLQEGLALRAAGVARQILVMGALFPEELPAVIAHHLTPVITDPDIPGPLASLIEGHARPYPVHIKIDTGMGRLGLAPEAVLPLLQSPAFHGPLQAEGLMTHLADADNADQAYTHGQIARLREVLSALAALGLSIPVVHAANSAGVIAHPLSHLTLVRPGLMLYGYPPSPRLEPALDLTPVLTLRTRVAQIRELKAGESVSYGRTHKAIRPSRIAVLPIGYADGYNRALSNRGAVLIRGQRARIIGRVCMDMTMVDVTGIPGMTVGEPVVVIGRQGDDRISAAELAAWLGTIPYEVLCAIGPRVPRIYERSPG